MKTIKQIAEEIGENKDKALNQVRKLPSDYRVIVGNFTYLTDDGMAIIKDSLVGKNELFYTGEITHFFTLLEKQLEAINKTN